MLFKHVDAREDNVSLPNTIRHQVHFKWVYEHARRFDGRFVRLYAAEKYLESHRVAVVTSRKIGKAVKRNRCRRRLKELIRTRKMVLNTDFDLIFIVKRDFSDCLHNDLNHDFMTVLKKAFDF